MGCNIASIICSKSKKAKTAESSDLLSCFIITICVYGIPLFKKVLRLINQQTQYYIYNMKMFNISNCCKCNITFFADHDAAISRYSRLSKKRENEKVRESLNAVVTFHVTE